MNPAGTPAGAAATGATTPAGGRAARVSARRWAEWRLGWLLCAPAVTVMALVPEDLLTAAEVDGATGWQRFTRVVLPNMKPAILVALLFRTLDAFRLFDVIFVLTGGSNETASVSMLAYDNLIRGLNLGIGATMSVLIFLTVAVVAFVFVRLFGTAAPGAADEGSRH